MTRDSDREKYCIKRKNGDRTMGKSEGRIVWLSDTRRIKRI